MIEKLIAKSDVLIEPFRAGVMEKLKLGPQEALRTNPRLIYARLTGFGQTGPLAQSPGHDLNFLAVSGLLSTFCTNQSKKPVPPLNALGDFAGGGVMCALGICMALIERNESGLGQVIDCNIVEGLNYLSTWIYLTRKRDKVLWPNVNHKARNLIDTGYPFYDNYPTKDGKFMAVAPLEPKFFNNFCKILGIQFDPLRSIDSEEAAQKMRDQLTSIFQTKTQEEWSKIFEGKEVCVHPVVEIEDASNYEHNKVRGSFLEDGSPRPSPILSRTPAEPKINDEGVQLHTREILSELGYSDSMIEELIEKEVAK